jgi:hypothetical protein
LSVGLFFRPTPKNRSILGNSSYLSLLTQPGPNRIIIGPTNGICSGVCFGFLINPVAFCADMGLERDKAKFSMF